MERSVEKSGRNDAGGIISLAKAVLEHREAIECDLLRETGRELNEVGRTLSWRALDSFLNHTEVDSALMRELRPELAPWGTTAKTNMILADIFDILAMINANLVALGDRKQAKKPKPYPRPYKQDDSDKQHIGSGALPKDELRRWFEEKRAQNAGNSTSDHSGDAGS